MSARVIDPTKIDNLVTDLRSAAIIDRVDVDLIGDHAVKAALRLRADTYDRVADRLERDTR